MRHYAAFGLFLLAASVGFAIIGISAEAGFSGTIHFTNGNSVFFDHLGTTSEVVTYSVSGLFGQQKVSYSFAELDLILFSDKEPSTVIIVNKKGERFSLTDCEIKDGFLYVYNDTVRGKLDWTRAERKDISHIVIGQRSGKIKMNATTQEHFPAMFVFDPFTGERLVWAEQGQPVPGEAPAEPATHAPAASPTPAASPSAAAAPTPSPTAVDQATAPAAASTTSDLRLTVVTPSTAIFFLGDVELKVSIQGPALFKETIKDANVETEYTLNFAGIPSGDYRVVAKYGTSTAVGIVRVVGANVEYVLAFD